MMKRCGLLGIVFGILCVFSVAYGADLEQVKQNKGATMQVLILGANGSVARWVIEEFLHTSEVDLRLYLRKANRLGKYADNKRVQLVEGDVLDSANLQKAMQGVDVVYANLAGDLESMAKVVVESMQTAGVKRLIWISSMGIYDEVPNQSYRSILNPYRDSAKIIESSGLDYTIIRPAWFSDVDEVDYGLTKKGEKFINANKQVSRKSIAHLVVRLTLDSSFGIKESLGIHKK